MNGERTNQAKDVTIQNHVWIGFRALILKGTVIPENSIVGTGAAVINSFEDENVVIAGVPAKIAKRDVNWIDKSV